MRMVEEVSAQLEEEQTISEHQDSPANDKRPPIADSTTSWSKPKIGPFQFSDHMSDMGKEDVTLTAKPMKEHSQRLLTMMTPSAEVMLVRVLLLVRQNEV